MVSVLHVGHTDGGVADPVVDYRVHWYRHAVLGQNLQQSGVIFRYWDDDLSIMEMWEEKIISWIWDKSSIWVDLKAELSWKDFIYFSADSVTATRREVGQVAS